MKPDEHAHNPDKNANPNPETPKIFALKKQGGGWRMTRKTFLEAASAMVGGVALTGCVSPRRSVHADGSTQGTEAVCAHKKEVRSLAISPDGKWLISGGAEGEVKLWMLPNGALVKSADASEGLVKKALSKSWSVDSLACSPDGKLLAIGVAGQSSGVSLWKLPDLAIDKVLESSGGDAFRDLGISLAISPDGRSLASVGGSDAKIKLWTLPTGTLSAEVTGGAQALAFTPDGTTLAVAGHYKGGIELRSMPELTTRQRLLSTPAPSDGTAQAQKTMSGFNCLAITPSGGLIVVACWHSNYSNIGRWNSSIELVSLSSGEVVKSLKKNTDLNGVFHNALAISPDGRLMASAGRENHIDLWSLPDGKLLQTLVGHSGPVNALVISPDGALLASGSDDKTIRLWSLPQGKQLLHLLDLEVNYNTINGVRYKSVNQYGQTVTYTFPCGSPIPAGAVCVCNCVPGSLTLPANHTQRLSSTGVCTCNLVCTCNTVCTCQAVGSPGGYGGHYWYPN